MTATYSLEGDGCLVMEAYEKIEAVTAAICSQHTPNVHAIARGLCSGSDNSLLQGVFHPPRSRGPISSHQASTLQQNIIHYATACVQPGLDHFNRVFDSNLKDTFWHSKPPDIFPTANE